jgi:hypothetical protein
MVRVADAIFNGIISGSAQGMSNYLQTSSNSEKKVNSVANERLANASKERPPVKTYPDGQDRHVVGSRNPGEPRTQPSEIPSFIRRMDNSPKECPPVKTYPDGQDRHIVGSRKPGEPGTQPTEIPPIAPTAAKPTQTSTLVEGGVDPENPSKEDAHAPGEEKSEESPKDRLTQTQSDHFQSIDQTNSYSQETPQSFSYTHDQVKSGLKSVFMEARKEAGLDGSFIKDKVSLNEIVTFAANRFTHPKGLSLSEQKKYKHAADLTLKKLENYIKEIAPQVDAKFVAKIIILESRDTKESSACVEKAAYAAKAIIQKQTQESSIARRPIECQSSTAPVQQKRQFAHLNSQGKVLQSTAHFSSASISNPKTEYVLGCAQIIAGGALMLFGGAIEFGSFGLLTVGFVVAESTGFALITQGLSHTTASGPHISFTNRRYKDIPYDSPRVVKKGNGTPPYNGQALGTDPAASPGKEFKWDGNGKPGSRQGSWYNPVTGESLHPDLDHPLPVKPHWDYEGPNGEKARLNIDGTWEWK